MTTETCSCGATITVTRTTAYSESCEIANFRKAHQSCRGEGRRYSPPAYSAGGIVKPMPSPYLRPPKGPPVSDCACGYQGRLATREHRDFHREWETRSEAVPTNSDLVDLYRTCDALIAHAHGGPLPKLTAGAQAILARSTQK